MIKAELQDAQAVKAGLAAKGLRIQEMLAKKINLWMLKLQAKLQANLAGGLGLQSRKGMAGLAGSIRIAKEAVPGPDMAGELQAAGGTAWYGRMWEQTGHREIVPVNKKALHFLMNGKEVFTKRVSAQGPRVWFGPVVREAIPQLKADIQAGVDEINKS
jgi:hypothetical protein